MKVVDETRHPEAQLPPRKRTVASSASDDGIVATRNGKSSVHGPPPPDRPYLPSVDEIKGELWRIATGKGSEASRVSALRTLADIMGLMKSTGPEFPERMNALLDALEEGLGEPGQVQHHEPG